MADLSKLLDAKLKINEVMNSLDGNKSNVDVCIDALCQISEDLTNVMIDLEEYDS